MRFSSWFNGYNCAQVIKRSRTLLRTLIDGIHALAFFKFCDSQMLVAAGGAVALGIPMAGLADEETVGRGKGNGRQYRGWVEAHINFVLDSTGQKYTHITANKPKSGSAKGATDIVGNPQIKRMHLSTANKEWAKKSVLFTDIFADLSHEFRTPLSVIQLATEILDDHVRRGELEAGRLRHSIEIINVNTRRLTRLVGNMLDIIRINAGAKQPLFSPVNMSALLRKLVELAKPYAARRGLDITLACRRNVRILYTDAEMAARIVVNLLSNAIKHTPRGGWVHIDYKTNASGCRISVEDNGKGIPLDMQRKIFDCFYKANNTLARSSEGLGIGLPLTKYLAELLGGSIQVKSAQGRGSTFFVDLPDRRDAGVQQNTGMLSDWLQDLVMTELSDISF